MRHKTTRSSTDKQLIEKSIPQSRLARATKLGGLFASVTTNIVKHTLSSVANKQKPKLEGTVLHIDNAQAITKHLSHMRGAAMKVGQMLSMDAGEFLPPEWESVLSLLRQQAYCMPKTQLLSMLNQNYGKDWSKHFSYFSFEPIAAASIGQVHKAKLVSGEDVAIKVQYPGVGQSIDSDIDNVGGMLKYSGLIPKEFELSTMLKEAKLQLKCEADYTTELDYLVRYSDQLASDSRFLVPRLHESLCTEQVLCMQFIDALPIEELEHQDSNFKSQIVANAFDLLFKELFEFSLIQSDPNFANYMFQKDQGKLVLLDFGACRDISKHTQKSYRGMAKAMLSLDRPSLQCALQELGLINEHMPNQVKNIVLDACLMAAECLQVEHYNFKQTNIVRRLQQLTQGLIADRKAVASPNFEVALINRKVIGTVLLANKMNVSVPVRKLLKTYIDA